jgi:hypothetical protein
MLNSLLARLLLVVSVALIPVLGFQLYAESQARAVRNNLMDEEVLRLLRMVNAEQQRIVESAEQVLDVLASSPSLQDQATAACSRLVTGLVEKSPRYGAVAVINLDGSTGCNAAAPGYGLNLADRDYVRLALKTGGFVIGGYSVGIQSKTPGIHFAKPLRDPTGAIIGVIALQLRLDWLQAQLARLDLPQGGSVLIADRNGIILARAPALADLIGKPMLPGNMALLNHDSIGLTEAVGPEGRPHVEAYSPPPTEPEGLFVAVALDREISFASLMEADRDGLALIICGGVLALALTALLGRRLIRRPADALLRERHEGV